VYASVFLTIIHKQTVTNSWNLYSYTDCQPSSIRPGGPTVISVYSVEPCAGVILSAAARRVILTAGGGAPIEIFWRRRRQLNVGGGGVRRRSS